MYQIERFIAVLTVMRNDDVEFVFDFFQATTVQRELLIPSLVPPELSGG